MTMTTFSAVWTDELGKAIREAAGDGMYKFKLHGTEAAAVIEAVNEGIDSHLEACNCPERGDVYHVSHNTIQAQVSPDSLPVLVRRLMEQPDLEGPAIASGICQTLDIELV